MRRYPAKKLNADRTFDFIEVEIFARPLVPSKNSFRRNKLGGEHVRAVFLAELPENFVRHARHRREKKRKLSLEPRKNGLHVSVRGVGDNYNNDKNSNER